MRNAVARFDQVTGVTDLERAMAFANIKKAARFYHVDLSEASWHDLGVNPQPNRKQTAAKGVATRKRTGVTKSAARKAATTRAKRKTTGTRKKTR